MTVTYFILGANRGLGFAFANELSEDSNNIVIATSRSFKNAGDLQALKRNNLHIIELDQSKDLQQIKTALTKIDGISPSGVDVVIHNGAICEDNNVRVIDNKIESFTRHFEINTVGPIKVHQAIYPYWIKKNPNVSNKKIMFVSSLGGLTNNFYKGSFGGYGVSKAALNFVNRSIAYENALSENDVLKSSISIAVSPGLVRSQMSASAREDPEMEKAAIDASFSASSLITILDGLKQEDNGKFFDYTGEVFDY